MRFVVSTVYGYNEQTIDSNAVSPTNQWVYIAVALLGRVGTLYFDGVAVGRNPNMDFPPFQIGRTPRNWIGRSQFLTGKSRKAPAFMHGDIRLCRS